MMLKEHKRIHIFYRLKGYWNTRIHTCTLTNTQIMQLEMGDGMCGENAFLFCNNLSLYLMHYHINRINSTPIAHSNHNRKEDKSRLVRIYLSMFGRIDLISEWFIFSIQRMDVSTHINHILFPISTSEIFLFICTFFYIISFTHSVIYHFWLDDNKRSIYFH